MTAAAISFGVTRTSGTRWKNRTLVSDTRRIGLVSAKSDRSDRPRRLFESDNASVPISDNQFSPAELRERDIVRRAIGTVITRLRKAANLTQVEAAGLANMSERELRRIEKGVGGTPLDRLWPLARAVGSTPAEIVLAAQQIIDAENQEAGTD